MRSVKELKVYKDAFDTVLDIYRVTKSFPKDEQFGLVSQMRRAAVSVCSNLAEGSARGSRTDFRHFVYMARGSAAELECQVSLSAALGFIKNTTANDLGQRIDEILKMLSGLLSSLSKDTNN